VTGRRGNRASNLQAVVAAAAQEPRQGLGAQLAAIPRLLGASASGRTKALSRARLLAVGVGLLYVVSPVDMVPEVILGPLGLGDDGLVLAAVATILLTGARGFLSEQQGDLVGGSAGRRSGNQSPRVAAAGHPAPLTPAEGVAEFGDTPPGELDALPASPPSMSLRERKSPLGRLDVPSLRQIPDPHERLLRGAARIAAAFTESTSTIRFTRGDVSHDQALKALREVVPEMFTVIKQLPMGKVLHTWDSEAIARWFAAEAQRRTIRTNAMAPWREYRKTFGRVRVTSETRVPAWSLGSISMMRGDWQESVYITQDGRIVAGPDSVENGEVWRSGNRELTEMQLAHMANYLGWK